MIRVYHDGNSLSNKTVLAAFKFYFRIEYQAAKSIIACVLLFFAFQHMLQDYKMYEGKYMYNSVRTCFYMNPWRFNVH